MKLFLTIFFLFSVMLSPASAQENSSSYKGETLHMDSPVRHEILQSSSSSVGENDPFEPVNRVIFEINDILDTVIFDPLSAIYTIVFPDEVREHIGYFLRNLSEPIVFANNILQGEMQDAEDTLRRFLINSTVGVAGIFDVSTSLNIPYKKEDFGLTLACWGFDAGPYIVIPILGPSNLRDGCGRIVDFGVDPINWVGYLGDSVFYSNSRTSAQIIDAKSDNEIIQDLKKNSIDTYATFRTWYGERREHLAKGDQQILESPHPDDDEEEEEAEAAAAAEAAEAAAAAAEDANEL